MERCCVKLFVMKGISVPVEFIVNEERKVVVAIAKDCELLGYASCDPAFRSLNSVVIEEGSKLERDMYMNPVYSAAVHCRESDTFDVAVGKKLALEKLRQKLLKAMEGRQRMLAKELYRMAVELKL